MGENRVITTLSELGPAKGKIRLNSYGSLAWRPDETQLAIATFAEHSVRVVDGRSGHQTASMGVGGGWLYAFTSVSWEPGGRRLVSSGGNRYAWIWELSDPNPIVTLRGHSSAVTSVAWCPTADIVATGSSDSTVRLWDVQSAETIAVL